MNWFLYEEGANKVRATGDYTYAGSPASPLMDAVYVLSDLPVAGYSQVSSVEYSSWLGGGGMRKVLVLRRDN